jgi:hypothetical protein
MLFDRGNLAQGGSDFDLHHLAALCRSCHDWTDGAHAAGAIDGERARRRPLCVPGRPDRRLRGGASRSAN